jgi:hypothetical protein
MASMCVRALLWLGIDDSGRSIMADQTRGWGLGAFFEKGIGHFSQPGTRARQCFIEMILPL